MAHILPKVATVHVPRGPGGASLPLIWSYGTSHGPHRMRRGGFVACAGAFWLALSAWSLAQAPPPPAPTVPSAGMLFAEYCVACHNDRLKTAGLSLEKADPARVADRADLWEK